MFGHHHRHHDRDCGPDHKHDRHCRGHRRSRHHGGPPPWVFQFMGGVQRPERGEVKYLILAALEEGPAHGYQVIQTIEKRTSGAYRPSPGTVYPTLQLLEEMELVVCATEGSRKVFSLTDAGRKEVDDHRSEVDDAWDRLGSDMPFEDFVDFAKVGARMRRVMRGARRGVHRGRLSPEDFKQVGQVIEEAIDRIEAIVFGSPDED